MIFGDIFVFCVTDIEKLCFFKDNALIQVIEPVPFKFNSIFFFLIVPQITCFQVCYF
tara:strand:- start:1210 stop:1380 length:171 start_codon:yes stop_codon:yes gene_type:complete